MMLVRNDIKALEAKVDTQQVEIKAYMDECFKNLLNEIKLLQSDVSKNEGIGAQKDVEVDNPVNVEANATAIDAPISDGPLNDQVNQYGDKDNSARVEVPAEPTTSGHKTPTLEDFVFPDFRESQIVALETKMPYVKPTQRARTKAPGKYVQSPYTDLSSSVSISENAPVMFEVKHPFAGYHEFKVDRKLIDSFKKWIQDRLSKKRGRKISVFTVTSNKINPPFDFGVEKVGLMDWFYDMVTTGKAWTDSHVNVIMYYLRKKCKYGHSTQTRVTSTDSFFINWVEQIHKIWDTNNRDSTLITQDHDIAQYIRGYKILANTPWDKVDYVCIPIHVAEKCHWVLVLFSIPSRCLFILDSLSEVGYSHTASVLQVVKKLSEIIPLFLVSTGFYGKRDDIDWKNSKEYADYAFSDKLSYITCENIPQQVEDSNDCGLYTSVFAEFICQGYDYVDIGRKTFDAEFCRLRYGTLLWDYGNMKIDSGAISESEVTGKVFSKFGGPRSTREHVAVSERVSPSKYVPRMKS